MSLGAGAASAQVSASEGSSTWVLAPNTAASLIPQNTRGSLPSASGQAAGWSFTIQGDWDAGDTFAVSAFPSNYDGTKGDQCKVPYSPRGVNQNNDDPGNYVGFSPLNATGQTPPVIESNFPAGAAPTFTVSVTGLIPCSDDNGQTATYQNLVLTATNNGNGQASQLATVHLGWSTNPAPPGTGAVLVDVGFGATTGPVIFGGGGSGTAAFAVESSVTVMGQRPNANSPRSTLVRNNATSAISGPIAEFTVTENYPNTLPPSDGYWPDPPSGAFNSTTHILPAEPPGAVCVAIENQPPGNAVQFVDKPGWQVDPGASASPNSAAAGPGQVAVQSGFQGTNAYLRLPVNNSSNKAPTVWTTKGLALAGAAYADGPIWAAVYWVTGNPNSIQCGQNNPITNYMLGYVQLATVSGVAPAVYGATAVSTAAQAVNHQFDYAKGSCISNTAGSNFTYGPSIFLARSDDYADGLGAAYAAGSVESGVLLTPPDALDPQTKDTIRLQGAQTVFVVGGPLAISDAVVNELKSTTSYHCGGTSPRLDPNTGLTKNLVVIRIFGATVWDTNQRLAEFVGAEPPASFGAFGANAPNGNPFNTAGGISQAGTPPANTANTALLVTGDNFQDAMVASVPAYGNVDWSTPLGQFGPMPLIATPSNSLSPQAVNAMFNQHIQQLIVVGGPLAVSDAVINSAIAQIPGLSVIRIAGQTASETSVQMAMFELSPLKGSPDGAGGAQLGMGFLNTDYDWDSYVNRTAGNINFNTHDTTARVVLMTRGDYFADAMAAAAVLSVHNGRWDNPQKFPLLTTESPSSLGTAVTNFLKNGSLYKSTLTGANPSLGNTGGPIGAQGNQRSSSVFTVQPVGGPLALTPALLTQAGTTIGS